MNGVVFINKKDPRDVAVYRGASKERIIQKIAAEVEYQTGENMGFVMADMRKNYHILEVLIQEF